MQFPCGAAFIFILAHAFLPLVLLLPKFLQRSVSLTPLKVSEDIQYAVNASLGFGTSPPYSLLQSRQCTAAWAGGYTIHGQVGTSPKPKVAHTLRIFLFIQPAGWTKDFDTSIHTFKVHRGILPTVVVLYSDSRELSSPSYYNGPSHMVSGC